MAVELPSNGQAPYVIVAPDQQRLDPARVAANLLARFRYADDWRKQYDEIAVRCYKAYVGWRNEVPRDEHGNPIRSNLHIPRTYEQIDTWRARLVASFWSSHPYIDFLPRPTRGGVPGVVAVNHENAKIASALLDQQLDQNSIVKVFYDWATELLIFPAAVMAVGWRYETRKIQRPILIPRIEVDSNGLPQLVQQLAIQETEQVVWDDNEISLVDYWDFWADPRGRDIDNCRFVFHREWLTRDALEERLELLASTGLGTVYSLDWDELKEAGSELEEGRWRPMSEVGLTPETRQGHWDEDEPIQGHTGQLVEVLHYWEDERHAILVNRKAVAYDGPNPYWRHGKKPFVVQSFEPLPNQFYGMSAVQIILHLQEETNTIRNQRIDNVSFVLNRMWKVRRSADLSEDEIVSRPGGLIPLDDPERDLIPVDTPDVTASSYNEEMMVKQDMENAIATPPAVRGVGDQRDRTAREIMVLSSNAAVRFENKLKVYEEAIKRLAYLMDCNNQQFIDTGRLVRMFGEDGTMAWRWVEPEQLVGEYDYRPTGMATDPAASKEIRRRQLTEMMQVARAMQIPFIDYYELTKMWLESFDVRAVQRLLLDRNVVFQTMAEMAAQQQAQEAQRALAVATQQQPQAAGGGREPWQS
mgnify:CR=1 FL=1